MQNATLFYSAASDFTSTRLGQVLMGFTEFFLNLILTLVVAVTLNVVSVQMYRVYLKKRKQSEDKEWRVKFIRIGSQGEQMCQLPVPPRKITTKERQENDAEKNMLYMALTLSSI